MAEEVKKPVGNAAAMREALEAALRFIGNLEIEPYSPLDEDASELRQRIMAALSEPPRNCDVGTSEEQIKRWSNFVSHLNHLPEVPYVHSLSWAQMPYTEGGTNEQG